MRSMFPTLPAELVELQPGRRGLLVLGGGVVAVFALSTLQRNNLAGHLSLPFRLLRRLDCEALSAPCAEISKPAAADRRDKSEWPKTCARVPPPLSPLLGDRVGNKPTQ